VGALFMHSRVLGLTNDSWRPWRKMISPESFAFIPYQEISSKLADMFVHPKWGVVSGVV
jgi:hypothetical protein